MFGFYDLTSPASLDGFRIFIPVVAGLVAFISFWFTQRSEKVRSRFIASFGQCRGSARFIMFTRYLGGCLMGIFPAAAFLIAYPSTSLSDLGLVLPPAKLPSAFLWTAGLCTLLIPFFFFSARNPKTMSNYPQIRAEVWDIRMVIGNLVSWAVYLLGYEIFFRGVLLFPVVQTAGVWAAIGINIGMYSGIHIPKGAEETIGAIPLSAILCLLCLHTGSFWPAFLVHVAMAWTTTLTSLKYHPDMRVVVKGKR